MATKKGQLALGCRRSCAGGHGDSQPGVPEQRNGAFLYPPPLPHSSATNLHFQLHFQPGGKDCGIITSGGLVTPEAGSCSMGWASGTHQEPRDGGKAGGERTCSLLGTHVASGRAWSRPALEMSPGSSKG